MLPVRVNRILPDNKFFAIRATHTDNDDTVLIQRIKNAQSSDPEVSQALETILKNGDSSITKGLQDWNLEDGIILHREHIYVPKDADLRRDIVKRYHNHP